MIFHLSKVLPALLFPVGLVCCLCMILGVLAVLRKAKGMAWIAFIAFGVLYASSSPLVSWALLRGLESQYPEPASYPHAAAIVLLGGASVPNLPPRRHPEVNANGDRVLQTARLWRAGLATRLVVTGGAIAFITGYDSDEATMYADLMTSLFDVPDSAILRVPNSHNTYEDARYTAQLFDSAGLQKDILLVTSAAHMPRSVELFQKQGFIVHPAPSNFRVSSFFSFHPYRLLPSEQALDETTDALHEYAGLLWYKWMNRL